MAADGRPPGSDEVPMISLLTAPFRWLASCLLGAILPWILLAGIGVTGYLYATGSLPAPLTTIVSTIVDAGARALSGAAGSAAVGDSLGELRISGVTREGSSIVIGAVMANPPTALPLKIGFLRPALRTAAERLDALAAAAAATGSTRLVLRISDTSGATITKVAVAIADLRAFAAGTLDEASFDARVTISR